MDRKLGRPTDQRMALIKGQASELLWHGRIKTTVDRAKEVSKYAEKLLTLAINTFEDEVKVTKSVKDSKGNKTEMEFTNDGPKKLAARRKIMSKVIDLKEIKSKSESKSDYFARTREIKHPLIEKMFNEYAPKYSERNSQQSQGGGYTRIIKLGMRRGDSAEMAILELV